MRSATLVGAVLLALLLAAPAHAEWRPLGGSVRELPLGGAPYSSEPALADVAGLPWIAWSETVANNLENVRVARWDGNAWQLVGGSLGPPENKAMHPSMTTVLGMPYVAWADYVGFPKVRVARWTGTTWEPVGDPIGVEYSNRVHLDIENVAGQPWVVTTVKSGAAQRVAAFRLESGAWAQAGGFVDAGLAGDGERPALAAVAGAPHVVFEQETGGSSGDVRVARFAGTSWTLLGGPLEQDASALPAGIADVGGAPAVAFSEAVAQDQHALRVRRWNGTAWESLGAPPAGPGFNGANRPVLLERAGEPHVGWIEDTDLHVARLRNGTWTSVGIAPPAAGNSVAPALGLVAGVVHAAWHQTTFDPLRDSVRAARLEPDEEFERAWGEGVVQGAPGGFEVCTVAAQCKEGTLDSPEGGPVEPQDAAVGPDGNVYVVDAGHSTSRVQVFTPDGAFVRAFGNNVEPGDTVSPHVCTDATKCGYGQSGDVGGALNSPRGIDVSPAGRVLVAEAGASRVSEFESDGTFVRLWGKRVNSALPGDGFEICPAAQAESCTPGQPSSVGGGIGGQLTIPSDVAADADGSVYVSERGAHRVQKFDAARAFVYAAGASVNGNPNAPSPHLCTVAADCRDAAASGMAGGLNTPTGIAVDPKGRLFVAEEGGRRVSRFGSAGGFQRAWGRGVRGGTGAQSCSSACSTGTAGGQGGQFQEPAGITIDGSGRVYVVDGHRIQRFTADGGFRRAWGRGVDAAAPGAFDVCRIAANCRAGESGTLGGELDNPGGAGASADGTLFVADTGNLRVVRFRGGPRSPENETIRISVDSDDLEANDYSEYPSVSHDGRYVAFDSRASDLVPGDSNGAADIFVRDRVAGTTERVSVPSAGGNANGPSYRPSISADGRYVAFESAASDLVAGDTNTTLDVFVHDRQTDQTQRVSVRSDGGQAAGPQGSQQAAISANGRFVAFQSFAANLVPGDTNDVQDVFVHDRQTGSTERVSIAYNGAQGDATSANPSLSADGRHVAFESRSGNLLPTGSEAVQIFVRDRQAGTIERVSNDPQGADGNGQSHLPSISGDGRYVAFESNAWTLTAGDTNEKVDVFVADRQSDVVRRVSVGEDGTQGDDDSYGASISADGRYVAFGSGATTLVDGDTGVTLDVYVHDREAGTVERISLGADGSQADGNSDQIVIAGDGSFVAYGSDATNLVPDDTNGDFDVFGLELGGASPTPPPPAAPTVTGVSPASGSNDNTPVFKGTAPAGTTVRLYGNAQCTGTPLAEGTAAAFASPGLEITVADNSTTTVHATASNADGTSPCSTTSVTYVESTPQTVIKWASTTASVPEDVGTIGFIVERTGNTTGTTSLGWQTIAGTAQSPGDFVDTTGTITFEPGDTQERVEVTIVDDNVIEQSEALTLRLSQPTGDAVVQQPSTLDLTIADDDSIETTITRGPEGPTNDSTPEFRFTADPANGATFECAVDDGAFAACTSPHSTAAVTDGQHTLSVRASKPNGAKDPTPATRTFFVDTVAPSAAISVKPREGLGFEASPGNFVGYVEIGRTIDDPEPSGGPGGIECALDPPGPPQTLEQLQGSCPLILDRPGRHTVYVAGYDLAGNRGEVVSASFAIVTPPDTAITGGPPSPTYNATPTFTFTSTVPGARFECRVDNLGWRACSSPYRTDPLNAQAHFIDVRSIGPEGAVDPSPARRTFEIGPEVRTYQCVNAPYLYLDRQVPPTGSTMADCYMSTAEQNSAVGAENCPLESFLKCVVIPPCPRGARCTVETVAHFREADGMKWEVVAQNQLNRGTSGTAVNGGGPEFRCSTPDGPGECTARSVVNGLATDGSLSLSCTVYRQWPWSRGPDDRRALTCSGKVTVHPFAFDAATAGNGMLIAYAPGPGTVTVAPGPPGRSATIAARTARKPFRTARKTVAQAGPVTFKLRLSKAAKRKLKRKKRLPLSVTTTFAPAGGGSPMRRTQRLVLRAPLRPLEVCDRVRGKRVCERVAP